jgi:hypothetical protein
MGGARRRDLREMALIPAQRIKNRGVQVRADENARGELLRRRLVWPPVREDVWRSALRQTFCHETHIQRDEPSPRLVGASKSFRFHATIGLREESDVLARLIVVSCFQTHHEPAEQPRDNPPHLRIRLV